MAALRNAGITNLAWRFTDSPPSDPAAQANISAFSAAYVQSRAGVVAAVLDVGSLRGVTVVTVFGYMAHRDVKASWSRGWPRLQCSGAGGAWVNATELSTLPASGADTGAFREVYGGLRMIGKSPSHDDIQGVRFRCAFDEATGAAPEAGHLINFRLNSGSAIRWSVDDVVVHCAGYPIVACDHHGKRAGSSNAEEAARSDQISAARVSVYACTTNLYGAGFDGRTMAEYVAWYLLLGAARVVIFESIEPDVHHEVMAGRVKDRAAAAAATARARRNRDAYSSLAQNLRGRVHVVRGLAGWEMMRRTVNHAKGQTLASNICKTAARSLAAAAAARGGRRVAPYVMQMDMDEFLVPPPMASSSSSPSRTHDLVGSLHRLAQRLETGAPVSAAYLSNASLAARRVETEAAGTGRCLTFADTYYLPPPCSNATQQPQQPQQPQPQSTGINRGTATAASASHAPHDRQPALLRLSRRTHPDKFELGNSVDWAVMRTWSFLVRSKYLASAADSTILGVHECCCNRVVHGLCVRGPRGAVAPCATVEHMPLEYWETRHFKHGLTSNALCGRANGLLLARVDAKNARGKWTMVAGTDNALPQAWANETMRAIARVNALMQA